ncbi:MAG: YraN family protein [Bacteroidetes bacterium]|nr:YraN family protein [Bacteroidota bacterium]
MNWNKTTGNKGEDLASTYLSEHGYEIIERNWRFRHAEVDIIASKNNRLHFFEIKTRTSDKYGKPEESMSYKKMNMLRTAAEEYQYQNKQWKYLQFDVLAITIINNNPVEYFLIEDVYF